MNPPCQCGNQYAKWRGPEGGRRDYCCDDCAKHLPADYEVCGTCGYDHTYDGPYVQDQIRKIHSQ